MGENAGPEREPRQGGRISTALELCREKSRSSASITGEKTHRPPNRTSLEEESLGAKTLGSLEECSSSFKFKRPLLNSYTGAVLGSGECLLKDEVKHAMPSRNSLT